MAKKAARKEPSGAKAKSAEQERTEEVKKWIERINDAKKVKENWRKEFRIALAYDYRDGKQRPAGVPDGDWITINRFFSNLSAELPTLYSVDPYFYIKVAKSYSLHPMDVAKYELRGKIRTSMLNYMKRELKLKEKVRLAILDAYFQFGVQKQYFQADMVDNPDKGKAIQSDSEKDMLDDDGNVIMEPESIPTNEQFKTVRVHPDDFLFDADAGPLEDDWSFLAQRIKMPLDDVRASKRYKKEARESVKPTEVDKDEVEQDKKKRQKGLATEQQDVKPEFVVMWEIYDLKKRQWLVVSEGLEDDYLIDPAPVPAGMEKHPFSILRLGIMRDCSPYPVTPTSQWIDPQREYCELRSKIMVHRKRFNRKYEMVDSAYDDPEKAASSLELGGDGTVLRRNGSWPSQAVFPIQDASLDQNHIQELIMLRNDFEDLATGANQQGSGAGIDSATESSIIEKRVTMREGDRLSEVMGFVTDIGRKLDQLVEANLTRDQAVKVSGPQGEYWELVRAQDYEGIDGEYEYSVNVGATTPQLPEIERAQWISFLSLLGNAPQLMLSKSLLKRSAEMHHIEDENLVNELFMIGQRMSQGGMPGAAGSTPGVSSPMTLPGSTTGGMAAGANNSAR
jgi:hypothetical protein